MAFVIFNNTPKATVANAALIVNTFISSSSLASPSLLSPVRSAEGLISNPVRSGIVPGIDDFSPSRKSARSFQLTFAEVSRRLKVGNPYPTL